MDSRRRGPGDGNSSSFFLGGLKAFALVFCDFRFVFSLGPLRFNAALAIDFKQIALTLDAKFKLFHNWSRFVILRFTLLLSCGSIDIILFSTRLRLSLRVSLSTCSRVCFPTLKPGSRVLPLRQSADCFIWRAHTIRLFENATHLQTLSMAATHK